MGCGCGAGVRRTTRISSFTPKCPEKYEYIRQLDLRVINLLNKKNDELLKQTNTQLRRWMRGLDKYCPSDEELETVESYIKSVEVA